MAVKAPEIWEPDRYIRPVRVETSGQVGLTHLAEVRSPDGQPWRAYVKHFGPNAPRGLFNEWFAYTVMSLMGVPQPHAALMQAPVFSMAGAPMAWAFVSCQPRPTFEGTPKQIYRIEDPTQHQALIQRLFGCPALPLLIAADQLLANADRNIGNLVFTGKNQFVAIDHSNVLGGPDWALANLWFTPSWATSKLIELLTPIANVPDQSRSAILASAQLVAEAFYEGQLELQALLNYRDSAEATAALDALWWRCRPIADWFQDRLQLVA
jgi:hypothetical protein